MSVGYQGAAVHTFVDALRAPGSSYWRTSHLAPAIADPHLRTDGLAEED